MLTGMDKPKKPLTPAQLLAAAKRVPRQAPYVSTDEVVDSIRALRKAGLTFKEMSRWFAERGHTWVPAHLSVSMHRADQKKKRTNG